jgi:hypothetical protein
MKLITGLLSDQGLTKKAYLNALTVVLDYGASLIVGFLITPIMVAGLGNYLFGMWQVLNRLIGYITPAPASPSRQRFPTSKPPPTTTKNAAMLAARW